MAFTLDNFVRSILAVDAAIGDTSLVVALAAPPLRDPPAASAGAPGILILQDQPTAPTKIEIVTYTGVSIVGTQVTLSGVTRGLEGTTAQAWTAGTQTFSGSTAAVLAQFALSANLGTASSHAATDFATAAQGAKADSALQSGDVGSAAFQPTTAFATAAQGAKADSAVQPGASTSFNMVTAQSFTVDAQFPSVSINPSGAGEVGLYGGWGGLMIMRAWKSATDHSAYSDLTITYNGNMVWNGSVVWHAGNFSPSAYMPTAGGSFTGSVLFPSYVGTFTISIGNADAATLSGYNTKITAWNGIGFADYTGTVRGVYDARNGSWTLDGSVTAAGNVTGANLSGTNTGDQSWTTLPGRPSVGNVYVQSADPGAVADGSLWVW